MHVVGLHIYPVKSTAPTDLDTALVEPWGLAGDRRWLVVDPDGQQMTARERRQLLLVTALRRDVHRTTLTGPGLDDLDVDVRPDAPTVEAEVWHTRFTAVDAGAAAARWFSELLDEPARLVHLADPTARPITGEFARPGESVNAADSHPLLLTTRASLEQVNDWIAADQATDDFEPLPMRRFRPNVVVEGAPAFAEDGWQRIRLGGVEFRTAGGCARCVLTTIDPRTLAGGKEPIRTLARYRRWDGKTWFGLNLIPTSTGPVSLGDRVEVLA